MCYLKCDVVPVKIFVDKKPRHEFLSCPGLIVEKMAEIHPSAQKVPYKDKR